MRWSDTEAVSHLVQTEPGFPVELGGAIELHAAFREESRTSLPSVSAARRKSGKAKHLFVFSQKENPSSRPLSGNSNCETALILAAGQYLAERKLR
jgi:hypothetical protein